MKKDKADELAVLLAQQVLAHHNDYAFSQTSNKDVIADELVELIEAISARLQSSSLA